MLSQRITLNATLVPAVRYECTRYIGKQYLPQRLNNHNVLGLEKEQKAITTIKDKLRALIIFSKPYILPKITTNR